MEREHQQVANRLPVDLPYLFENAPAGILIFKKEGDIIYQNKVFEQWLELPADALPINIKFHSFLSKARLIYYNTILLPLLTLQKSIHEIKLDLITLRGSRLSCLFNVRLIELQGYNEPVLFCIVMKIEDRNRYETQLLHERRIADNEKKGLEFFANSIPVLTYNLLPNGKLDFVNDRIFELLKIRRTKLNLTNFAKYIHPEDYKGVKNTWRTAFETKKSFESEFRIRSNSAGYQWFLARTVPYMNEGNEVTMWFGSLMNIQTQKEQQKRAIEHLEGSLVESKQIISKNEVSFKEIAFEQSHLVRMPLSNILGISELLGCMQLSDEASQLVTMLKNSAIQLDSVIESIVHKTN